ncbi:MAG: deoxyribodipyrimidine photo-lyase [Deltaproteobacteria bacterium]|nr:deoxyribodipyrimidine photo-lyase [Candidatus Zymogenaceae bacterium]
MTVHPDRIHALNDAAFRAKGPVVYWMSRDQRADDNWALLFAQNIALERREGVCVLFVLADAFLGAALRQYRFMLSGLSETARDLASRNIPFYLVRGEPGVVVPAFVEKLGASCVITDFDPLRIKRRWKEETAEELTVSFLEVDAHNIVPCRAASVKGEYSAGTYRPRLTRRLGGFLVDIPAVVPHPHSAPPAPEVQWDEVLGSLTVSDAGGTVDWIPPGPQAALTRMHRFIDGGLSRYDAERNDPTKHAQSELSPYLHFGQLSAQRLAREVGASSAPRGAKDAFLEELIVRRELSDNFCLWHHDYDSSACFPDWAKKTLKEHGDDHREHVYTYERFRDAETHDPLWNAAQKELVVRGTMPGYLRMYWAKKILEWTESPEAAMEYAVNLNDTYQLDGRDPNGYAGVAWSIGGVHDRAWGEREIFGKVRYMSHAGCRRKFNVDAYIKSVEELSG